MKNILINLTPFARNLFINNDLEKKLEKLGSLCRLTNPADKAAVELTGINRSFQPNIVVSAWGSPKLEMKHFRDNPHLEALFQITGAVKPFIEKDLLNNGVKASNWGGFISHSVAEGTLTLILSVLRRMTYYDQGLHLGTLHWKANDHPPETLFRTKIGIHGFGRVARELVKLLKPFQCQISTYSPHTPQSIMKEYEINGNGVLTDLYAGNNIVVNLAAGTPENHMIVTKEILALIPDGGCYILTGRADTVDFDALRAELKSERIYAGIDVFPVEPLALDDELRKYDNCTLTPHMAGPTPDLYPAMGGYVVEKIADFIETGIIADEITPDYYDNMT